MSRRSLPALVLTLALILSVTSVALIMADRLPLFRTAAGGRPWPWDVRAIFRQALQDALKSDETRVILEDMFPEITLDKDALTRDILATISTSPEARQILKDALSTPEARQAFADALKSPEAEQAIREVLATPRLRKVVADLVRESMRQGY
ncbi:MAG: GerD family protein [Ignavibacteriales bacterium]